MRKFTSGLILMLFSVAMFAQNLQNADLPAKMNNLNGVSTQFKQVRDANNNLQQHSRATTPFPVYVDFDFVDDEVTVNQLGGTYDRFLWRLNDNFPNDSLHDLDLQWAAVVYDTLIDENLQGYSFANNPVTLDSFQVYYQHENNSGNADTLVVYVYQASATASGITVGGNNRPTNTVLWSDTIITSTSLSAGTTDVLTFFPATDPVNPLTLATGTKFAIGVRYFGDTTDYFSVIGGYGDLCAEACVAKPAQVEDNSQYRMIFWQSGQSFTFNSTGGSLYFDCDGSNNYTATGCEDIFLQNFAFPVFLTIAPPLTNAPFADDNTVCPGTTVTLSPGVSGGNAPYTYEWTGGVSNPFDSTTAVVIPTNNLTDTIQYCVKITDANGDTTRACTRVFVRGISVNAGTDVQLACGATTNLTATLGGSFGGGTVTTWTGCPTCPQNTVVLSNQGAGTYTVTATNATGCSATDQVVVSLPITQTLGFDVSTVYNGETDTITTNVCEDVVTGFTNTSSTINGWEFTWSYGAGEQATTTDASTLYAGPGLDTVTLQADSASCSLSYSRVITILAGTSTNCVGVGIGELNLAAAVNLFPNPTTGKFNVSFAGLNSKDANIQVFDLVGKLVAEDKGFVINGNETRTIDLGTQANGIYFVRMQVDGTPYTTRVNLSR